jgi:predicted alpha-1,2-mannosidase
MIGYHSVSVIADAMVKGIKGFDYEKAFEASKHSAMLDQLGLKAYKQKGFIAVEDENESVSKTLEYAYDDWCIAQMAYVLKKKNDYNYFMKRSQSWKNVFDTETGFMRPKKNGGWLTPFEPREINNNYTEGNAWQYTFFVPQDIPGLIDMMGGKEKFENKLDELFSTTTKTTGREQADVTGLIGQYAHGNEPSHHMAYLYNFISEPSKTQQHIHQLVNEFYKPSPDGLIGNEDCGQMSAWYVLSSLGMYEVTPGSNSFMIGSTLFKEAKVHLENGKTFSITANNVSKDNCFIKSTFQNGVELAEYCIFYQDIISGTTISFNMANSPRNDIEYATLSYLKIDKKIIPVPTINTSSRIFIDSMLIEIKSMSKIFYSIQNVGQSTTSYKAYSTTFLFLLDPNQYNSLQILPYHY